MGFRKEEPDWSWGWHFCPGRAADSLPLLHIESSFYMKINPSIWIGEYKFKNSITLEHPSCFHYSNGYILLLDCKPVCWAGWKGAKVNRNPGKIATDFTIPALLDCKHSYELMCEIEATTYVQNSSYRAEWTGIRTKLVTVFILELPLDMHRHADTPHSHYQTGSPALNCLLNSNPRILHTPPLKFTSSSNFLIKKSSNVTSIINKYSMVIYFRDIFFSFLLKSTWTVSNFSLSDNLPVSLM